MKHATIALILTALTACTAQDTPDTQTRILAIGDSVMSWNSGLGAAIPDVIEQRLGVAVADRSVPGARFANPDAEAAAEGFDIRAQYVPGDWDWVVLNGGANDLSESCDCAACDEDMEALLSSDGQIGAIAQFVQALAAEHRVLIMGYSDPWSGPNAFSDCADELAELGRRQARLAASLDSVAYVDAGDVLDSSNAEHWFIDRVHPSPLGSRLIGTLLANTMETAR